MFVCALCMDHYWPLSSNKLPGSGQGQDLGFDNDAVAQSNTKNQSCDLNLEGFQALQAL